MIGTLELIGRRVFARIQRATLPPLRLNLLLCGGGCVNMKLTNDQKNTLQLVMRSPDRGEGWRTCSPILFEKLVMPMPDELFEKNVEQQMVRLTEQGRTLVEWM